MPALISETAPAAPPPSHTPPDDSIPVVPLRHPVRQIVAILLVLFAAVAAWNVATNHRFGWDVVANYLFAPEILRGALLTVVLTVPGADGSQVRMIAPMIREPGKRLSVVRVPTTLAVMSMAAYWPVPSIKPELVRNEPAPALPA